MDGFLLVAALMHGLEANAAVMDANRITPSLPNLKLHGLQTALPQTLPPDTPYNTPPVVTVAKHLCCVGSSEQH
jgi:hypothetical protein